MIWVFFNKVGGKFNVMLYFENFIYGGVNFRYYYVI